MTSEKDTTTTPTTDREIVISRVVNAPRELVWEAWTQPEHVARWWGPRGFTTTIQEMDVKAGGAWRQTLHGPDGTDYPNKSIFSEVVKPERIVYSLGGGRKGGSDVHFESTWTFDALEADRTRVTIRMVFATAEDRDKVAKEYGAVEGGKQTLERLAELLAEMPAEDEFAITRIFSAPRPLVWKAWTKPEHLARWWGPHTFTNPVCELDLRPEGAYRMVMRATDGVEYPITGVFREIVVPERIVMTMDCSEHPEAWHDMVNPNRPKGDNNPAGEMLQRTFFEDLGGQTRLTIRTRFESVAIRNAMVKMGMYEGWSQSLERLAECLARLG